MYLQELATIATYLNYLSIRATSGSYNSTWLTGKKLKADPRAAAPEHEETQCLSFGSTLWIANNDDRDSEYQRGLLTELGIGRPPDLLKDATRHGSRLLNYHEATGGYPLGETDPKAKLLYQLLGGTGLGAPAEYVPPPVRNACGRYSLKSGGTPPSGAVVFITGDYDYVGGGKECHAEQKLLAALGIYMRSHQVAGSIAVAGTKLPCTTCGRVLAALAHSLRFLYYSLYYSEISDPGHLNAAREYARMLAVRKTDDTKALDLRVYFPGLAPASERASASASASATTVRTTTVAAAAAAAAAAAPASQR